MRRRTAFISAPVIAFSVLLAAQGQEFARVLRNGEQATLSVFGPRPVDLAAKKLVDEFGVAINVEDPVYIYRDDVQDIGVARSGKRILIPKASLLEMRFDLNAHGSLLNIRQVVRDLVDAANAQLPFLYRIDNDGDVFTLVPSRTRDEQGRSVDLMPILDRHVTIPLGTRKIFEHVNLLTQALEQQTGVRISCCQAVVGGIPWGSTVVSFEARHEPARSAFLRLVRSEQGNPNHIAGVEPRRYHWLMRCQPGESWCFINVAALPDNRQPDAEAAKPTTASTPAPVRSPHITPPRKTKDVPPGYPPMAAASHVQGVVIVEVTIGPDGKVLDAKVLRSIPLLDQAALEAVRQWEFTPTLLNGNPIPFRMTVTVKFPP